MTLNSKKAKTLDNTNSIAHEFFRIAKETPDATFARVKTALDDSSPISFWNNVSCSEIASRVIQTVDHLRSIGVTKGTRVAIISNSRLEWLIADLAILSLGAVSVSVYQSLLAKEIAYILYDSETSVVFAENQEQLSKLEEIAKQQWEMPETEISEKKSVSIKIDAIITFEDCKESPLNHSNFSTLEKSHTEIHSFAPEDSISRSDLASLVYTSGTTGAPKGVMQTHGNHLANVRQVVGSGLMIPGATIFLFLPLAHSFARLMGYLACLTDLSVSFPEVADSKSSKINPSIIMRDMGESSSDIFPIVPRLLEKIKDQLILQSEKTNFSSKLLRATIKNAVEYASEKRSFKTQLIFSLLSPMRGVIRKKIFGANFKYCVSGGAKLSQPVHLFFDALGFPIYEGYGLTETVVATNACKPSAHKIGSVGKVLSEDIEVQILESGEVAYRGPNISPGYLNRPKATSESWTKDGWFLTGDLGHIDSEGFLYITGRKKEIIVTSGGKNVAPLPIEEKIMDSSLISQAVLIGDGRKYCSAIITINKDALMNLATARGERVDVIAPNSCENVKKYIWEHLNKVNTSLSSYETVKKIYLAPEEFSIENGLLTPSMKIRRKEVEKKFSEEIERFYA